MVSKMIAKMYNFVLDQIFIGRQRRWRNSSFKISDWCWSMIRRIKTKTKKKRYISWLLQSQGILTEIYSNCLARHHYSLIRFFFDYIIAINLSLRSTVMWKKLHLQTVQRYFFFENKQSNNIHKLPSWLNAMICIGIFTMEESTEKAHCANSIFCLDFWTKISDKIYLVISKLYVSVYGKWRKNECEKS